MKEAYIIKKVYSELYTIADFFFPRCEKTHSAESLVMVR